MSENAKINLTSAEELIGEFLLDFDIQASNFIGTLNRHIVRGIELMNIETYFTRQVKSFQTEECRTPIPCESKYIEVIAIDRGGQPCFLDLTNSGLSLLGRHHIDGASETYGYVDGAYINFKTFEGRGFFLYKSIPLNSRGFAMIPDDALVKEALLFFIVAKLALSGYKHKVVGRDEAESKWAYLHPQARNSVNFPSVHDIEAYTENNINPLFNNPLKIGGSSDLGQLIPNINIEFAYPGLYDDLVKQVSETWDTQTF
tara:strand:+ start:6683 stop:7456 length:774 start_codon:yes stop_codon:yes gene_type:complete